ncbi:seven-hairpin glycosidase [Fomitiporia mediterranea MF3/22]|uniref:seven-hairpin glycosidase n=1 Tax=Fomitiporia mediterranea (strain MF3/22) TaxID=694068 RepID=UPI0004407D9D|nr:seven-hairpin glycosidase [Fomitiporia mediterranea MF3/22]EJD07326.1 seven-hairpin glycosidase [Fomitiporia mediterranea MF3/22]
MSTMLPMHRASGAERGWRAMAVDNEPSYTARLFAVLRPKPFRGIVRSSLFIIGGAFFLLWFMFMQFGGPPFLSSPFPPPRVPRPGYKSPFIFDDDDDVTVPQKQVTPEEWAKRAEMVKQAFVHAYHGYEQYASPMDELLPLTDGAVNNFNGWGVTMVDSLDTIYLMGLHDEFDRGIELVKKMAIANHNSSVPFFETVIRYLGGLLSAYGLSKDPALLQKADELGAALLPAFNTSSGFPTYGIVPATGDRVGGWGGRANGWLAELASCTMEYKYLAKVTGKKEYYEVAQNVMRRLYDADLSKYPKGLLPSMWTLGTGQPVNLQVTIGAYADSAFEYFLKQYLLTNQTDSESLELYLRTMRGVMDHMLYLSPTRSFLYVTDITATSGYPSRKFEHLSCFLPGLLALGANQLPAHVFAPFSEFAEEGRTPSELERHIWAAKGLGISCGTMYSDMPVGLGADEVAVTSASELEREQIRLERVQEAERLREEAKKLAVEKEREHEKAVKGRRAPPVHPDEKFNWSARRPVADKLTVNQTEEDYKSRWTNVLAAWRRGLYDGKNNVYLDVQEEGGISGGVWREREWTQERIGLVPGLRDPPYPARNDSVYSLDYRSRNPTYQLRPETIESFFVLWRTTGEEVWRQRGWAAFKAIEKNLRTPSGYATVRNVFNPKIQLQDSMPSFFLAETLKYLYLLFSDDSILPLDKYVLNTEAHPFPVFEWTEAEKEKFGIKS